ncbi:hypothetical protein Tco_1105220 [Tanacetum coccineum]
MHVVVWRNKSDLGSISFDDLYNNFKIVEPEVKRSVISSSNSGSRNLAFLSSHSSTKDVNTTNVHVSTGSTPVSTASTNNSIACLSDATVYAYLATQPNGSQVVHEDLEQIHEDDLDEMDLKWQLALLNEEASTNFALMAFSDSKLQNNKTCSKTCLKNFEDLKLRYDKLRIELNKSESNLYSYKKGLASVEEQLVFYKKNEGMLCDQIDVLKSDASFNESDINALKKQVERLKKEKEDNQFKIDNFENASKSLDQMIGNQISDNNKKGLGYNVVPPLLTGLFAPPSIDLSNSGLEKFKQPEFEGYGVKMVQKPVLNNVKKGTGQREVRPVWTNAMRVNHQKISNSRRNFTPTTVLTKSGLVPFSTARQSFSRTTAPVSAARSFNTAVPSENVAKPRTNAFQKSHSQLRRPFYQQT